MISLNSNVLNLLSYGPDPFVVSFSIIQDLTQLGRKNVFSNVWNFTN